MNNIAGYEIKFSTEQEVIVPLESSTSMMGLRILSYKDSIIYIDKSNSIYSYDYLKGALSKDTTLKAHDYALKDHWPIGVLDNKLVLFGNSRLAFYDMLTRELNTHNLVREQSHPYSSNQASFTTSSSFGFTNRTYRDYIPFVARDFAQETTLYLFDGERTLSLGLEVPSELLNLIYKCNPNLFYPLIEPDHIKGGYTIAFYLSCRVFHFSENHQLTEYKVVNPDCDCEITQQNFVKATPHNFFPETLPLYGNVFSDPYRNLYYQFYKAPIVSGENQRESYLRILDGQFNLLASIELDWNDYKGNLLILEDGTYIQSSSPPYDLNENYIYFHKVELVEDNVD